MSPDAMPVLGAQGAPHLSPAEAAQAVGVSRWSIMRAINGQRLQAIRDNRNNWRISPDDLAAWQAAHGAHSVRYSAAAQDTAQGEAVAELRERLAAATARAEAAERARDQAEAERDGWRAIAERLADRPRARWWPFRS